MTGYEKLTFLDAYSGYNQISITASEEKKTSFITKRGTYCYRVIPFGLKNAGATYQRLINKMFEKQIGRTVEAYIDDMVVKNKDKKNHRQHLQDVLSDKCKSFFDAIKVRKGEIWRAEQREALAKLKEYITNPPILSAPEPEEPLYLYLAISQSATSSALAREVGKKQHPVFYSSKAMTDVENRAIFSKLYLSGQITKWAIELSSFDIQYESHTAKKGQVIVDFLLDTDLGEEQQVTENPCWELYVDGSSSQNGAEADSESQDPSLWTLDQIWIIDTLSVSSTNTESIKKKSAVYHPQGNRQAEITNTTIFAGIKKKLEDKKEKWLDELPNVLWAYRTTPRRLIGETPFILAYGTEAVIPTEMVAPTIRSLTWEQRSNNQLLERNLNLLEEKREAADIRLAAYQQRITNNYNKRARGRSFNPGDLVLLKS
ncbi:uncharacterized protein LOC132278086 [Cornus florida]|uniref:uncharacterized protein LOC132278086 n=1 Tax=Cornus florida TaxID=4283 RepID=UPI00289999AF|nr:uncharacterized protein LOC132278086 [Cornus florida]